MRLLRYVCGAALLVTLASGAFGWRWYVNGKRWLNAVFSSEAETFQVAEVEARISAQLFCERLATGSQRLEDDDKFHDWLSNRSDTIGLGKIDELLKLAHESQPQYLRISAYSAQSTSLDGLLEQIGNWEEHTDVSFTHQVVVARPRPARLGYECVIFAGQRLPDFVPESMAPGHELFFSKCPLCGQGQPCQIPRRHRSISLECPKCHRIFAMIAPDTKGVFHHMSDYLTGYAPRAHFASGMTRYREMVTVWRCVTGGTRYRTDGPEGDDETDVWQFARETQKLGTGDCEDSAILLCDWLNARGFEARIALGRFAERGGHAWVVVRLADNVYLLESTNPYVDTLTPPLAVDVGSRYVPETQIDREGFFIRRQASQPWDGDYFASSKWVHIKTQHSPKQEPLPPLATLGQPPR